MTQIFSLQHSGISNCMLIASPSAKGLILSLRSRTISTDCVMRGPTAGGAMSHRRSAARLGQICWKSVKVRLFGS